jgi:hypothetical protein
MDYTFIVTEIATAGLTAAYFFSFFSFFSSFFSFSFFSPFLSSF